MNQIFVFVCLLLLREIPATIWTRSAIIPVDPSKFDYCSTPCLNPNDLLHPYEHVACNCEANILNKSEAIEINMETFRKLIVDVHNEARNRIASGAEAECPRVANMMLLKYDLELEYIAGCHIKLGFDRKRGKIFYSNSTTQFCRKKALHPFNTGRSYNATRSDARIKDLKDHILNVIKGWYYEFKNFPEISKVITKFEGGPSAALGLVNYRPTYTHFTQIVWGSLSHVGCAMLFYGEKNLEKDLLYRFQCNYAGWKGGTNILNEPVYLAGEPCTRCPFGTECEEKSVFKALCVNRNPIPGELSSPSKLTDFKSSPNIHKFPLMYSQKTEKSQSNIADELIAMGSPSTNNKNVLMSMFIIMIGRVYLL